MLVTQETRAKDLQVWLHHCFIFQFLMSLGCGSIFLPLDSSKPLACLTAQVRHEGEVPCSDMTPNVSGGPLSEEDLRCQFGQQPSPAQTTTTHGRHRMIHC